MVGSERRDRDVVGVAMSSGSGMSLGSVWDVVETEEGSEQETRGHARTCNADLTGNSLALSRFRWIVFGIWRKLLSRRRRKGTILWDQFHRMLGPDLLPQPVDGTGRLLPSAQMADRNMMRYQFDARVLGVSGSPTASRRMKLRRMLRALVGSSEASIGMRVSLGRRKSIALEREVRDSMSQRVSRVHTYVASRTGPFGIVGYYRAGNGRHI